MSGTRTWRQAIAAYLALLEQGVGSEEDNLAQLSDCLDELAWLGKHSSPPFEDGHPDPPDDGLTTYGRMRELARQRFPSLGFYNVPNPISQQPGEAQLMVADAFDDIAAIANDLHEVAWRLANTADGDAAWQFRFGYESHWGHHVQNLRWYLHARVHGF